ncbi:hypothetical protein ACLK1Y_18930 [Escherichia coli]
MTSARILLRRVRLSRNGAGRLNENTRGLHLMADLNSNLLLLNQLGWQAEVE